MCVVVYEQPLTHGAALSSLLKWADLFMNHSCRAGQDSETTILLGTNLFCTILNVTVFLLLFALRCALWCLNLAWCIFTFSNSAPRCVPADCGTPRCVPLPPGVHTLLRQSSSLRLSVVSQENHSILQHLGLVSIMGLQKILPCLIVWSLRSVFVRRFPTISAKTS